MEKRMHKTVHIALALAALALGIWAYYALPGWVGLLVCGVLLLCAVVATVIAALGRGARQRGARLWREFFDSLYGL
jgi:uncharacterized membrane protein